jgi:hypothetical protein
MGLNAVVYKKIPELPEELQGSVKLVDPISGEIEYSDPDFESSHPASLLLALDVFLGNVSMIAWVSKRLREVFPERDRPLLEQFLRGATQSGAVITLASLPSIEADLADLENRKNALEGDVRQFVESVERLVSAARTHSNSIVFI